MPPDRSESTHPCGERGFVGIPFDLVILVFEPAEGGGDQLADFARP